MSLAPRLARFAAAVTHHAALALTAGRGRAVFWAKVHTPPTDRRQLVRAALGPSLAAYRCWGLGVAQGGPNLAAVFNNLTPLFAAVLSAAVLGEAPQAHHALAFALIVGGISVSVSRPLYKLPG